MMIAIIITIITIIILLFILWAEILYYLAGKDNKILFGIIFVLGLLGLIIGSIRGIIEAVTPSGMIWSIVLVLFILFWASTLYEQAGYRERRWYYLTLIIPLLSVVYQIVSKK